MHCSPAFLAKAAVPCLHVGRCQRMDPLEIHNAVQLRCASGNIFGLRMNDVNLHGHWSLDRGLAVIHGKC